MSDSEYDRVVQQDLTRAIGKAARRIEELETVLRDLLPRHSHCGSCCTFDAAGAVIVTVKSCVCDPPWKAARIALGWLTGRERQSDSVGPCRCDRHADTPEPLCPLHGIGAEPAPPVATFITGGVDTSEAVADTRPVCPKCDVVKFVHLDTCECSCHNIAKRTDYPHAAPAKVYVLERVVNYEPTTILSIHATEALANAAKARLDKAFHCNSYHTVYEMTVEGGAPTEQSVLDATSAAVISAARVFEASIMAECREGQSTYYNDEHTALIDAFAAFDARSGVRSDSPDGAQTFTDADGGKYTVHDKPRKL